MCSQNTLKRIWLKNIPKIDRNLASIEIVRNRLVTILGTPAQAIARRAERRIIVSLAGYEKVPEWLDSSVTHEIGHFVYQLTTPRFRNSWECVTQEEGSVYEDITGGRCLAPLFSRFRAEENFADWYRYKVCPSYMGNMSDFKKCYPKSFKLFKRFWIKRYGKW